MYAADRREGGFTLVEMLVALSIFSLAALAVLRLQGAVASNSAILQDRSLAQIVAANVAVETVSDPTTTTLGEERGETVNGGRTYSWVRTTRRSPEPRIQQIEIRVVAAGGRQAAALTIFKRGGA